MPGQENATTIINGANALAGLLHFQICRVTSASVVGKPRELAKREKAVEFISLSAFSSSPSENLD